MPNEPTPSAPTFTEQQLLDALQLTVNFFAVGDPVIRKATLAKLNKSEDFREFVYLCNNP